MKNLKYLRKSTLKLMKMHKSERYNRLKARLIGYLAGDGYVAILNQKNGSKSYEIHYYPDHASLLNLYIKMIKILYGKKVDLFKKRKIWDLRIRDKAICLDLFSICKSYKSLEWEVPNKFLYTKERKREFLKAFFDSEAYVGKRQIQIQSVNKKGLLGIKRLLKDFDIGSKFYIYKRKQKNWNINYLLSIMKKEDRIKFLKEIGFNHIIKLNKLKSYLSQSGRTVNALVSN